MRRGLRGGGRSPPRPDALVVRGRRPPPGRARRRLLDVVSLDDWSPRAFMDRAAEVAERSADALRRAASKKEQEGPKKATPSPSRPADPWRWLEALRPLPGSRAASRLGTPGCSPRRGAPRPSRAATLQRRRATRCARSGLCSPPSPAILARASTWCRCAMPSRSPTHRTASRRARRTSSGGSFGCGLEFRRRSGARARASPGDRGPPVALGLGLRGTPALGPARPAGARAPARSGVGPARRGRFAKAVAGPGRPADAEQPHRLRRLARGRARSRGRSGHARTVREAAAAHGELDVATREPDWSFRRSRSPGSTMPSPSPAGSPATLTLPVGSPSPGCTSPCSAACAATTSTRGVGRPPRLEARASRWPFPQLDSRPGALCSGHWLPRPSTSPTARGTCCAASASRR